MDDLNNSKATQQQYADNFERLCGAQTTGDARNECIQKQVPQRELLMRRLRRGNEEHEKLNRAIAILEAHPEFEDFMWLLRNSML
jgi:hypothetical protein